MATFQVELKRVVDDSYPIEIGFDLMDHLVEDMKNGLLGGKQKLAVITDSEVEKRYAEPIAQKLEAAGFTVNIFTFSAGEKSRHRKRRVQMLPGTQKHGKKQKRVHMQHILNW